MVLPHVLTHTRKTDAFCAPTPFQWLWWVALVIVIAPIQSRAQSVFDVIPIARLGDAAPVPPTVAAPQSIQVNASGQILLSADGGLLLWEPGRSQVPAAPGDELPNGRKVTSVYGASLNNLGEVAAVVSLSRTEGDDLSFTPGAVLLFTGGKLTTAAVTGDPAPGGGTFRYFGNPSLSASGLAFIGFVSSADGGRSGVYVTEGGGFREVLRLDDPALGPGFVGGRAFRGVALSEVGSLAIEIEFDDDGPTGVFVANNGAVTHVAGPGVPAPGGGTFTYATAPTFNVLGDLAFLAAGTTSTSSGIFLLSGGILTNAVASSSELPFLAHDFRGPTLGLNALRQIAFRSFDFATRRTAIHLWQAGTTRRIAGSGDLFDGQPARELFGVSLNDTGLLAFTATFDDSARIFQSADGSFGEVLRSGATIPAVPRFASPSLFQSINRKYAGFVGSVFPGGNALIDEAGVPRLRSGTVLPRGGYITGIQSVSVGSSSHLAAVVSVSDFSTSLLVMSNDVITELARAGDPAPGGGTFTDFDSPSANAAGAVAFGSGTGVYLFRNGETMRIASKQAGGSAFVTLSDAHQVAFKTFVPGGNAISIWSETGVRVALSPGLPLPGGGTTGFIDLALLNEPGGVAFSSFQGVFVVENGAIRTVARQGDPAPGGGSLQSLTLLDFTDDGEVLFKALKNVDGVVVESLLLTTGDVLEVVFALPRPAPSVPAVFDVMDAAFTTEGQILFSTSAFESGVFKATRRVIHPVTVEIATPNEPSMWGIGTRQTISWAYNGKATHFDLEISRDGGTSWEPIATVESTGPTQNFRWTVTGPNTSLGRIRVREWGGREADVNDADISISDAAIGIILPTAGGTVRRGARDPLFIQHNLGARTAVAVDISTDGGVSWRTVVERARTRGATTSELPWRVDVPYTNRAVVRVRALDGSGVVGVSAPFRIRP